MNVKDYRRQIEADQERARSEGRFSEPVIPGPDEWATALALLRNPGADTGARLGAHGVLQAGAFDIGQFAPFSAAFATALQGIAVSESEPADLRMAALDHLVNEGDAVARQVLTAQIEDPHSAVVPLAAALEMLTRDDHGSGVIAARRLMVESDLPDVRAQAARVLGSDPASLEVLQRVMTDPAEAPEVRQAGAVALRALQSEAFRASARSMLDAGASADIRATIERGLRNLEDGQ